MALFLSPYSGAGTKEDPFRPQGIDQPGVSAIDIRLDPTVADGGGIGWALMWVPVGLPDVRGGIKIADDHGETTTALTKGGMNTRLGLDFTGDVTIQDVVETILLRPDTFRWKQLRPANGRIEAWLGSGRGKMRWVDMPVVAGGSITDNFNRGDENPVAAPWGPSLGETDTIALSSNALTGTAATGAYTAYFLPGGWLADHSTQITYASAVTINDWAPAVRLGSDGLSAYRWEQWTSGRQIRKTVAGSSSTIEATSGSSSVGTVYKLNVAGSTIRYYENGSEHADSPATDSSLVTAGDGPGIILYQSGGAFDDWVGTGIPTKPMFRGL